MNSREIRELTKHYEKAGYSVVGVESGGKHSRMRLRCADGFEFFVPLSNGGGNMRCSRFIANNLAQTRNIERQQREKRS